MTEAILAGEEVEEFPFVPTPAAPAAPLTILTRFAKDFFMGDGPGNAGHGNCEDEEFE